MKSILLATASILAFAGAAAAEVTFGGSATLGYNLDDADENNNGIIDSADCGGVDEDDGYDCEEGFFWEADLAVTFTQELNNGLVAGASFGVNITDDGVDDNQSLSVDDNFLVSLTGEAGGLYFGDTSFAAEKHWDGVPSMNADRFSEQDDEVTLRGDFMYMGIDASVSYVVADAEGDRPEDGDLDQLSIGASATFGAFNMTMGYQQESQIANDFLLGGLDDSVVGVNLNPCADPAVPNVPVGCDADFTDPGETAPFVDTNVSLYDPAVSNGDFSVSQVFGISAGTTFGGADVSVAYAMDMTLEDSSLGFEVKYPFGPVTLGAYYVMETDDPSDYDAGSDFEDSYGISADYASGPITVSAFYTVDGNSDPLDDKDDDFGVEASYAVDDALTIYAGYIDSTEGYIGAEYDLGGGATAIVSWAEQDEEGAREYEEGITVALNLAF